MIKPNNIYLGDCYELIKQLPDKSIGLVITDPPYEIVGGGSGGAFGTNNRNYHLEYTSLDQKEAKRIANNYNNLKKNLKTICTGFDYSLLDEIDRVMKHIYIYIYSAIRIKYQL